MLRILGWTIGGVLLGVILHIGIVLSIPYTMEDVAKISVLEGLPDGSIEQLNAQNQPPKGLANLDPFMTHAVCGFSLSDTAVSFEITPSAEFWSLAVIKKDGTHVYSMTDRAIQRDNVELVLLTRPQLSEILENQPDRLANSIVVTVEPIAGFFLFRGFQQNPTDVLDIQADLTEATCGPVDRTPLDGFPGWEQLML